MRSYCFKCRKYTKGENPKVIKDKNGRMMLLSKYVVCNNKKSKFIKKQQARELLSNLTGIKVTILSDSPIINTLF